MPQVSSTALIAVARFLLSLSFGEGGDLMESELKPTPHSSALSELFFGFVVN